MLKYQIAEIEENLNHAGTKATADIVRIAQDLDFKPLYLKMSHTQDSLWGKVLRQWDFFWQWRKVKREVKDNAVILLQHPFHHPQLTREKTLLWLKKNKNVKFISLIHDVEELRKFRYNDYYKHEFEFMLQISDVYIVHNDVMKQFFVEKGIKPENIVVLEIFDYLYEPKKEKNVVLEQSISLAGNLDTKKCGYIAQLKQLDKVNIHLYGPNYIEDELNPSNINYHGSFPSDEIPDILTHGFGLVWDGSSIDGCLGDSGQYLRYNNPHKLSLYIAAGLPVIIWKDAAEAKFVEENNLGICVEQLRQIPEKIESLSDEQIKNLKISVSNMGSKLRNGYYGKKAIERSVRIFS